MHARCDDTERKALRHMRLRARCCTHVHAHGAVLEREVTAGGPPAARVRLLVTCALKRARKLAARDCGAGAYEKTSEGT